MLSEINLAIVGAGMQTLTLVAHLLQKRQKMYDRFVVFAPTGKWIQ
ncbi:hypothetical protein ACQ4M3_24845 [Leptolyngbya sp. AN03gr2]